MKVVVQRVNHAAVRIAGVKHSEIGKGLLLLVGFTTGDDESTCVKMAHKLTNLRIFTDENDKLNLSLRDIEGQILSVSQFTLYADCRKGRRPSFGEAMVPGTAKRLYERFNLLLEAEGAEVMTGVFQADMQVELENDGPVTIILDSKDW